MANTHPALQPGRVQVGVCGGGHGVLRQPAKAGVRPGGGAGSGSGGDPDGVRGSGVAAGGYGWRPGAADGKWGTAAEASARVPGDGAWARGGGSAVPAEGPARG